ncbi:fibronectin type III domain-containing protein [bacterium 210820-DFI.6.37]|nr:fibronectin type III domain-containing protein [bacterium 210820-DFI.6.37]
MKRRTIAILIVLLMLMSTTPTFAQTAQNNNLKNELITEETQNDSKNIDNIKKLNQYKETIKLQKEQAETELKNRYNNNKTPSSKYDDKILPEYETVEAVFLSGQVINLHFTLFSFGNTNQKYYVDLYDDSGNLMGSCDGYFPSKIGETRLTVTWDTYNKPLGKYWIHCYASYSSAGDNIMWPFYVKARQTVAASNKTTTYGGKSFKIGAKSSGTGQLVYSSSNQNIIKMSSNGMAQIKGTGIATITINAKENDCYLASKTKKITVTVNPKKSTINKVTSSKKGQMKLSWKKDNKATGYQIVYAKNKKFTSGKKTTIIKNYKTTSKTIKNLSKGKKYYVKMRAYKTANGKKLYGAYSTVKNVKIK